MYISLLFFIPISSYVRRNILKLFLEITFFFSFQKVARKQIRFNKDETLKISICSKKRVYALKKVYTTVYIKKQCFLKRKIFVLIFP